jgi:Ca-activated chloride channel homolog
VLIEVRFTIGLCAAILVFAAGILHSQGRIEINVIQVPIVVTVTDGNGQLIPTLNKTDFKVFEGNRQQKIDFFARQADLPLSVVLLIDQSSSTADLLEFERDAAMDFFSNTLKKGKDRAMVIGFATDPHVLVEFTDDLQKLEAGLKKLNAGGGTAVYDSVFFAAQQRLAKEEGERRKLIILISDGYDTASRYSLKEALDRVQRHDALVYAISVNRATPTKNEEREDGDKAIRQIVNETGGRAYFPLKLSDMSAEFAKIESELRSQYSLSFTPQTPLDGTYRKLRVELIDKKFKARSRTGYIASKN